GACTCFCRPSSHVPCARSRDFPTSGRRHLQGFVWFVERKRFASAQKKKKKNPFCHFEANKGYAQQAAEYCKKDGDFGGYGRLPDSQHRSDAFAAILASAEEGDVESIKRYYPGRYIRYKGNILSSVTFRTSDLENSCGVWICGPPRCGKDAGVRRLGNLFSKPVNKWLDGYRNEKFVLLSDIEPSHSAWLGYYMKIWSDRYPFHAEIKGASMLIRPIKIFCISNFRLDYVFSGQVLNALQARFNVFDQYDKTVERRRGPLRTGQCLAALEGRVGLRGDGIEGKCSCGVARRWKMILWRRRQRKMFLLRSRRWKMFLWRTGRMMAILRRRSLGIRKKLSGTEITKATRKSP
ncbi:hypothetical protein AVEN_266193-1, partial [Araneus ventricosus]